jgi:hypothetical protein
MELANIEKLVEKYENAATTLQEEAILKNYFTKEDVVVILFHDHGSRYVGKIYNDEWMRKMGYID